MILTPDKNLKIIDFEGCSIDGAEAGSSYEWFSYRKSTPPASKQTDIFAFGCAAYEIITGKPPHHELEKVPGNCSLVEKRYAQNQFPDTTHLPLGEVMQGCWQGDLKSMAEIKQQLEVLSPSVWKRSVIWMICSARQILRRLGLSNTRRIFSMVKAARVLLGHLLAYCVGRNL
jgi:serine/threonine protein kinase